MAAPKTTQQGQSSDLELLDILDMTDRLGVSATDVGRFFGRGRNAILGLIHRIHVDERKFDAAQIATKPENRNGGMPARWWEAGLSKRAAE